MQDSSRNPHLAGKMFCSEITQSSPLLFGNCTHVCVLSHYTLSYHNHFSSDIVKKLLRDAKC